MTRKYIKYNQIKFKTSMLRSILSDYGDAYILVNGTITINGAGANNTAKQLGERNEEVIFKNCAPFIDFTNKINNTQIDYVKDLDNEMPMYNLIEYSDNYAKTSESLW